MIRHTHSLPLSVDNESLEHGVSQVHNPLKSGKSHASSQAITNLESKSLTGKFMCICSQTFGKNISFVVSCWYKLHGEVLMLN